MKYPKRVTIIELENAPFRCAKDAIVYAKAHGIVGVMSNADTGGKGEISISVRSLDKMLSGAAVQKSITPAIHLAAIVRLRDIIRESFIAERILDSNEPHKAYSYEISNVEVLRGNAECAIQPSNNTSTFDVGILLNGVCDVNGVPLVSVDATSRRVGSRNKMI